MQGCDASVMIASPNGDAEKDAQDNLSLAGDGFDTVIKAKQAVESVCPGVVSCADVLTIATRDVVGLVRHNSHTHTGADLVLWNGGPMTPTKTHVQE